MSANLTKIGSNAFSGCSAVTSITIPDSVTVIGEFAFDGCTGVTSVTIGNGVASIGRCAFYGCNAVGGIRYNGTVAQWEAISKADGWARSSGYCIYCTDGNIPPR